MNRYIGAEWFSYGQNTAKTIRHKAWHPPREYPIGEYEHDKREVQNNKFNLVS